jgi:hypothetical protein
VALQWTWVVEWWVCPYIPFDHVNLSRIIIEVRG